MTNEQIHEFRKEIDGLIVKSENDMGNPNKDRPVYSRELSLVKTKLQEAKMWAEKMLEINGSPFPEELRDKAN
jgi:hypothetical protein